MDGVMEDTVSIKNCGHTPVQVFCQQHEIALCIECHFNDHA